ISVLERLKEGFDLIRHKELSKWTRKFVFYWELNGFPDGPGADILNATAAISIHHAYQHGWVEHVFEVVEISYAYREIFEKIGILSEKEGDLLLAGAFLHDVGKLFQFKCTNGVYEYSDLCKAYGWHSNAEQIIGSNMLLLYCTKEEFPPGGMESFYALNNMIISHHGNQHSIGNSTY
ncbi:HD domain-containing protein, partial [candidate division KSB1 bacterium]|nr:HD domain-containing protein [candidate division KSB1 bacterium]NIU24209.1 HD domain-containing protein [candidate division KSB1 bacterium]